MNDFSFLNIFKPTKSKGKRINNLIEVLLIWDNFIHIMGEWCIIWFLPIIKVVDIENFWFKIAHQLLATRKNGARQA